VNKLDQYLNKIFERERKITEYVNMGYSLEELIGKGTIYSNISKKGYRYYAEKRMIELHLERILEKNQM